MNRMIALLMTVLLWAWPQSYSRIEPQSKKQNDATHRAEIDSLIAQARQSPPEFAAHALLRIAEASEIVSLSEKKEIIEEAFRFAAHVRNPVKQALAAESLEAFSSREGFLAVAFTLDLDALSLRCRAIKAMLKVDRKKARELFDQIQIPKLQPPGCEQLMVYDFSSFYDALMEIAQTAFSPEEMRAQEHINFMEFHIGNIEWSDQLAITAKGIRRMKTSALQLERLVHAFSLAMNRVRDGDRSFSYWLVPLMHEVKELTSFCRSRDISRDELLASLRSYLVRYLTAARCSDTTGSKWVWEQIKSFNDVLRLANHPSRKEVSAIEGDDLKPAKIDPAGKLHYYLKSPKSKSILDKFDKLDAGVDSKPLDEDTKDESYGQIRLTDFLNEMDSWDIEEGETEADGFHKKITLLRDLLLFKRRHPGIDRVIEKYIDLLSRSYIQRSNPIEWFWHVKFLLKYLRDGERRLRILEAMRNSKNPSLYLFTELERILPQSEKK